MVTNVFSNIFGSSPVRPLQRHMAKVTECVSELTPYFHAVLKQDWEGANTLYNTISSLEQDADKLKKELRLNLPKGMMLPVSRRDLLEVLTMQDNIANKAKDIAGLVLGRKMKFPDIVSDHIISYVQRCIDTAKQAEDTVNELDELVETGFKGSELELVEKMIQKLDEIESDTDRIQVSIRASLYAIESTLAPVDAIFLYKIIEDIGAVADIAQRVGSRLQILLAR